MDTIKAKCELYAIDDWKVLRRQFYSGLTFANSGEPYERLGAERHDLGTRLRHLEEFWRCHVAPATNRPDNISLSENIHPLVSRMAETNYEIYCNIVDALEEMAEIRTENGMKPPRYVRCLNVLRFSGDALQLFGELRTVIDNQVRKRIRQSQKAFEDWEDWKESKTKLQRYRHMLVHHGRPRFFFTGEEHQGPPYILRPEYCGYGAQGRESTTWSHQKAEDRFKKNDTHFQRLDAACQATLDDSIAWLDRAYKRVVSTMEPWLHTKEYKRLWRWPAE